MSVYKALVYILVASILSVPWIFNVYSLNPIAQSSMFASAFFMGLSISNITAWLNRNKK